MAAVELPTHNSGTTMRQPGAVGFHIPDMTCLIVLRSGSTIANGARSLAGTLHTLA
ncbi:MAG TPA: hypothetical protein VIG57_00655 [Candidatus Entotheonella sp.]